MNANPCKCFQNYSDSKMGRTTPIYRYIRIRLIHHIVLQHEHIEWMISTASQPCLLQINDDLIPDLPSSSQQQPHRRLAEIY